MIYLLISAVSAFFGMRTGLGATTLLRPLLDAVSPLPPASIALLSTMAALGAALLGAFFALSRPLPLHQDELILLASGSALGGVLGELVYARFSSMIPASGVVLLQNALLFSALALPDVYFHTLAQTIRPLSLTRLASLPVSLMLGLLASFLAFGAQPITLMLYFLLFDAENEEASVAALCVSLFAMAGKLITQFIRLRLKLPDADVLLWLLPGALLGTLAAMIPVLELKSNRTGDMLLKLSLFTALINMASSLA